MDITFQPAIKAFHIIFMVGFFAGTFAVGRLFIMHKDALTRFEPDRTILSRQLIAAERWVWYVFTWPSLVLMLLSGLWLLSLNPALLKQPWMHAKLGLVALLVVYHLRNQMILGRAGTNDIRWSSFTLRIWNAMALVLLAAPVFLAVLKNLRWEYGALGLATIGAVLVFAVSAFRKKAGNNVPPDQGSTTTRLPNRSK